MCIYYSMCRIQCTEFQAKNTIIEYKAQKTLHDIQLIGTIFWLLNYKTPIILILWDWNLMETLIFCWPVLSVPLYREGSHIQLSINPPYWQGIFFTQHPPALGVCWLSKYSTLLTVLIFNIHLLLYISIFRKLRF